jgi:hypothetical protein
MKKYLFSIACLLFLGGNSVYTQEVVPNGSFENWTGYNPDGWIGLFNSPDFQNVFESDDAQNGSHSVELKVVFYPLLSTYVYSSLTVLDYFPVTSRPGALNGYFKGTAAGNDSLTVIISMSKDGNPIGYGFFFTNQDASDWTSFSMPITYYTTETPNEGYIYIFAGQSYASTDGTDYFIDNLTFSGPAGIDEKPAATNYTLFPNPAGDILNVSFSLAENDNIIFEMITPQGVVIPVSGKVAFQQGINTYQIATASFSPGIYFLKARGEKYQTIGKVTIKR